MHVRCINLCTLYHRELQIAQKQKALEEDYKHQAEVRWLLVNDAYIRVRHCFGGVYGI